MKRINYNFPQPPQLFSFEQISKSDSLFAGNIQGVCFDGTYYYVTESSSGTYLGINIKKYTRSGGTYTLVATHSCVSDNPTDKTQINGIEYHDGYLWVSANNFILGGSNDKGWVIQYDPSTFSVVDYFSTQNYSSEGIAFNDVGDGDEMWHTYNNWSYVSRYKKISGIWTNIGNYEASLGIYVKGGCYNGIAWYGDYVFLNRHEPNQYTDYHESRIDVYKWNGNGFDPVEYYPSITRFFAGQAISWETYGSVMLFADRDIVTPRNNIIRAQFNDLIP